jgi:hypothetical protein
LEIVFAINERERDISWYNWTNMVHKKYAGPFSVGYSFWK